MAPPPPPTSPHPRADEASEWKDVFPREPIHQRPGGVGGEAPTLTPNSKISCTSTYWCIFNQERQEKPIKYSCRVAEKRKKFRIYQQVLRAGELMRCEGHEGGELGPARRGAPLIGLSSRGLHSGFNSSCCRIGTKHSAGGPIRSQSVWLCVNGGKIQPHISQNTPNALHMINNYSRRQLTRRHFSEIRDYSEERNCFRFIRLSCSLPVLLILWRY